MTVMKRLVERAATYTAQQIAAEFKDRINPFGGEAKWEREKNDWHVVGGLVPYPCPDADLISQFLAPSLGGLIGELKLALEKSPEEKLTFFYLAQESLERYDQFFKDKDYKAQVFCGDVAVTVSGSYINGKRRLFISLLCTPLTGRAPNVDIKDKDGE